MTIEPDLTDTPQYGLLYVALTADPVTDNPAGRLELLRRSQMMLEAATEMRNRVLDECERDRTWWGSSTDWEAIGAAMGVTKQAASQFYKRRQAGRS